MAKNTSLLLGDHFNEFISEQITSGQYSSASEVIQSALRLFEQEENKKKELINELKKGENAGFFEEFNPSEFLNLMHKKHASSDLKISIEVGNDLEKFRLIPLKHGLLNKLIDI